jgi:hypothetical protein
MVAVRIRRQARRRAGPEGPAAEAAVVDRSRLLAESEDVIAAIDAVLD